MKKGDGHLDTWRAFLRAIGTSTCPKMMTSATLWRPVCLQVREHSPNLCLGALRSLGNLEEFMHHANCPWQASWQLSFRSRVSWRLPAKIRSLMKEDTALLVSSTSYGTEEWVVFGWVASWFYRVDDVTLVVATSWQQFCSCLWICR